MWKTFFIVGFGSFIGGGLRFLISRVVQNYTESSFPLGTLIVNLTGCFVIGVLYALFEQGNLLNTNCRMFLAVGVCGGFTTFSTFMNENYQLLKDSNFFHVSLYVSLSLAGGIMAIYLGHLIIKLV